MSDIPFGVAWILMGIVWLRRAYVAEKAAALAASNPSFDHPKNRREQRICTWLGIANLILGVANIWKGLLRFI